MNLIGDNQNNVLQGTVGYDYFDGKGGNDVFHGGGGYDYYETGSGNNTLYGSDYLNQYSHGKDTVHSHGNLTAYLYGGDDYVQLYGPSSYVEAGNGDDTVIHTSIGNTTGSGKDTIFGGAGDDVLSFWGGGNDLIYGGDGDDVITGDHNGDSTSYAGNGDDVFRHTLNSEESVVSYGCKGVDEIEWNLAAHAGNGVNGVLVTIEGALVTVESTGNAPYNKPDFENVEHSFYGYEKINGVDIAYSDATKEVATLYANALDRQADFGGLQHYALGIESNQYTKEDVAWILINSSEFANTNSSTLGGNTFSNATAAQQIEALYEGILGRASDTAGFNAWMNAYNSGSMTIEEISGHFVNSTEFDNNIIPVSDWCFA